MRHQWETRVLRFALAAGLVHVIDEYLVRPAADVDPREQVAQVVLLVGLGVLAAMVLPVLWAGLRALVMAVFGAALFGDGGTHVVHLLGDDSATGVDLTGLQAGLAGATLVGLACGVAFRRDRPSKRPTMRWADRGVTLVVVLLVGVGVVLPVGVGTVQVHLPQRGVAGPPADDFSPVALETDDGVRLRAFYRPSRNGAAVMVLSSSRGDLRGVDGHARLLAEHGYGVLVYDARGSGASGGVPNGWGWTWREDVEAGLDFLDDRPDVLDDRIGLLGLSTGADVAIEVAAVESRVRVVVADGATAQGLADHSSGIATAVSLWWMYAAASLLTGEHPAPPLADAIAAIAPRPVLLVAGGSIAQEIPLNERYAAAGGDTVTLWALPDVDHIAGLRSVPDEYAQRVLAQLDSVLLPDRRTGRPLG